VSEVFERVAAETVPLGELLIDIRNGLVVEQEKESPGIPITRIETISKGTVDMDRVRYVRDAAGKNLDNFWLKKGDILFSHINSDLHLGKTALVLSDAPLLHGMNLLRLRVDSSRLRPKYLHHWLDYCRRTGVFMAIAQHAVNQSSLNQKKITSLEIPHCSIEQQDEIVAEIEKQFSRLDEAVANLQRVKANLKRYDRATIASLTNPESFEACVNGTIADIAISLDNMRKPVNKLERAKRPGNIPYLGANGQTGWIDVPLFDEELVLVVEDETFVGRTDPFCYYFAEPCWVNNHTHVLRARPEVVSAKYLNLALSYYPFIPLTTGSTGRRKLTKAALMTAPISVPSLRKQAEVIDEVERCLSIAREVEAAVDTNLKRAQALRQASLATAFGLNSKP
jgi:restriction endonuclease S subunit